MESNNRRLPVKLSHSVAAEFLGFASSTYVLGTSNTPEDLAGESYSSISANASLSGLDAEGIAVATQAVDESIWSDLAGEDHPGLTGTHYHSQSFLAAAFIKLKPLGLKAPAPPKAAKMWVPNRYLSKASGSLLGRLMLVAGMGLVAGAAIGAALYLGDPAMKIFAFLGDVVVHAGAAMGSVIMAIGQCMADHGLACPLHGLQVLLHNSLRLATGISGSALKAVAKLAAKMFEGAIALGGLSLASFGKVFKWIFHGTPKLVKYGFKIIGASFEKLLAGILGLGGVMFKGMGKMFAQGGKAVAKVVKNLDIGALLLGMGTQLGKLGAKFGKGIGKMGANFGKGIGKMGVNIGKGFGKMGTGVAKTANAGAEATGKGVSTFIKDPFGTLMMPLALALGALGKLGGKLKGTFRHLFMKALPRFVSKIAAGSKAMYLGAHGLVVMGSNAVFDLVKGGWQVLGTIALKFFEGTLRMTKFLFDQLGKMVLAGVTAGIGLLKAGAKGGVSLLKAGIMKIGKYSKQLLLGGAQLLMRAPKIAKNMIEAVQVGFNNLAKLFAAGFKLGASLVGSLVNAVDAAGSLMTSMAKMGFGFLGKALLMGFKGAHALMRKFGIGVREVFTMLGKGLILGLMTGVNGLAKLFTKGIPKVSSMLITGVMKMAKMTVKGMKAFRDKLKVGAIALAKGWKSLKKGIGSVAKGIGKVKDPRWYLTAAVLALYALHMLSKFKRKKPGWGMPGTHESSSVRLPELGWRFKGGKAWPRYTTESEANKMGRHPHGVWLKFKVPRTSEGKVQDDESRGDGKKFGGYAGMSGTYESSGTHESSSVSKAEIDRRSRGRDVGTGDVGPRLYQPPGPVNWDTKPGDVQVVETSRSPGIDSIDMQGLTASSSSVRTSSEGLAASHPSAQNSAQTSSAGLAASSPPVQPSPLMGRPAPHPAITLNSPETSVRVQMYDTETGRTHWDSVYFLDQPGKIDASAREIRSSPWQWYGVSKHVSSETPPGGWRSFQKLSVPADDMGTHRYQLVVTKYPSNVKSHIDDGMEDDVIGTAQFDVYKVQEPTEKNRFISEGEIEALKKSKMSVDMPGTILAALSPDDSCDSGALWLPFASSASLSAWRRHRHHDFWKVQPRQTRSAATVASPSGSSMRQQAEAFFAPPARGRPILATQ